MIFAALLCAGIVAMLAGFVAKHLVHPTHLEKDAVAVESAAGPAAGGAGKVAMAEPIVSMIVAADVERGKAVAKACAACHNFEQGGPNGVGPNLFGVVGNKKQSHPGFAYSGTLDKHGGDTWTYHELNKFIWKPKAYDPDTKMNFIGIKKPEDRAAVIAYLRTLGDKPAPTAAEIEADQKELTPAPEGAPAEGAPADAPPKDPVAAPAETPKKESTEKDSGPALH